MSSETGPVPLDANGSSRRRLRFEPSINAGHVLSMVSFLIAGSLAYADLRERVTVQEHNSQAYRTLLSTELAYMRAELADVKREVSEQRRRMEELAYQRR